MTSPSGSPQELRAGAGFVSGSFIPLSQDCTFYYFHNPHEPAKIIPTSDLADAANVPELREPQMTGHVPSAVWRGLLSRTTGKSVFDLIFDRNSSTPTTFPPPTVEDTRKYIEEWSSGRALTSNIVSFQPAFSPSDVGKRSQQTDILAHDFNEHLPTKNGVSRVTSFDAAYSRLNLKHNLTGRSILQAYPRGRSAVAEYDQLWTEAYEQHRSLLRQAATASDTSPEVVTELFNAGCSVAWHQLICALRGQIQQEEGKSAGTTSLKASEER